MTANVMNLFSLQGRSAVVMGASRGIGAAIAVALAEAGAQVLALGRSAQSDLPSSVQYQSCDARDAQAVSKTLAQVDARSGLDVYVHCAGITLPDAADTSNAFAATIEANLVSAHHSCTQAAQWMQARRRGSIIAVTSIGSVLGFPGNPGYVAAKGGLRMMCKALALDLGPHNVRVNCLAPGYIHTAMTSASFADPAKHAERLQHMMLPRWGTPADLAGAAVFLASDASSYVTGSDLFVDGGWTAKGL